MRKVRGTTCCHALTVKIFRNRGKSPCQTDNKPQYLVSLLHACSVMLAVPPKFACKSWISQLYELIARWQRKRLSAPGDQNMHRLQLFSTPWKLCSVVNTCREKKKTAHDCVEIKGSLYVITHMTGFRLGHNWNRTTMGDNTVTGLVTIAVLSQGIAIAYANFYCVSGKAGDYV